MTLRQQEEEFKNIKGRLTKCGGRTDWLNEYFDLEDIVFLVDRIGELEKELEAAYEEGEVGETLNEKFFLDQDADCHWYVVPHSRRQEWNEWCSLDPEQEEGWEPPHYAYCLGRSPNQLVFSRPWNTIK